MGTRTVEMPELPKGMLPEQATRMGRCVLCLCPSVQPPVLIARRGPSGPSSTENLASSVRAPLRTAPGSCCRLPSWGRSSFSYFFFLAPLPPCPPPEYRGLRSKAAEHRERTGAVPRRRRDGCLAPAGDLGASGDPVSLL